MDHPNFHVTSVHIDGAAYKKATGESRFYCDDFELKPGMNLLFGGNGQGKSSLLEFLSAYGMRGRDAERVKKHCRVGHCGEPFMVYSFSNSRNNPKFSDDVGSVFAMERVWDSKHQSEGQTVMQTICDFLNCLDALEAGIKALILIDEIDSGLDACACRYIVRRLKTLMGKRPELQIVLAFNQYEMSKLDSRWLNVCTGKLEPCPKTYDEYVDRLKEAKRQYKRKVDRHIKEHWK